MRLPVNVARGFTPVSEVDIDDDRRPSTVMTAMASFSGEPWHHASLPPTRRHSLRLPVKPCGSPPEADCDNNGVFSVNAARSCHYAGLPCWSARHAVFIPVRCSMTMLVKNRRTTATTWLRRQHRLHHQHGTQRPRRRPTMRVNA